MKKVVMVVILIIMLLPFYACDDSLPMSEEIMDNVVKAMGEVESYQQDTNMTMKLYFMAEDMPNFSPWI